MKIKDIGPFPVNLIEGVTLDTRVKEIHLPRTSLDENMTYVPIPSPLHYTKRRDLFYLAGDVNALTTRQYLKSVDPEKTLADLFSEPEGDFYPCGPRDAPIKSNKTN